MCTQKKYQSVALPEALTPKTSINYSNQPGCWLSSNNIDSKLPSSWGVLRAYLQEQFLPCGALLAGERTGKKDPKMGTMEGTCAWNSWTKFYKLHVLFFQGHINLQHTSCNRTWWLYIDNHIWYYTHIFSTYVLSTCKISPIKISRIFQAFWGLVTMLFLLFGAWSSTPGSGSFLSAVALELHDDENWVFFSGWVPVGWPWWGWWIGNRPAQRGETPVEFLGWNFLVDFFFGVGVQMSFWDGGEVVGVWFVLRKKESKASIVGY